MKIHVLRRDFLKSMGSVGMAAAIPGGLIGCRTTGGADAMTSLKADVEADFLTKFGPITSAALRPAGEWLGDAMTYGHETIRDDVAPDPTGPREQTDLVIVGGGMSGLGVGYLLREKKPMFLEINPNFGGNSRGETWNGISYAIGAAYLVPPDDGHPLMEQFYKPLNVANEWRLSMDGTIIHKGKPIAGFWQGALTKDPNEQKQLKNFHEYMITVANAGVPEIPPSVPGAELSDAIKSLDKENFLAHLEGKVGKLLPSVRAYLEHYCWSSFGTTPAAISAAGGLNFLAGEIGGIAALPGGNAQVTMRLMKALLASGVPEENFRAGASVRAITQEGGKVVVTYTLPDGTLKVVETERVVVCCPKFIAKYIVTGMPESQSEAIGNLSYNAYVTANVLINKPMTLNQYDMYLLGDLQETFADTTLAADHQGVTDVILGHWAQNMNQDAQQAVLTLYRGLPYRGGRGRLHGAQSFKRFNDEISAQLPQILGAVGVNPSDVKEMRLARFGHPLVAATPGNLANGVARAACQPIDGKIFFCNQDNWSLPCIETALGSAIETARAMG